ncbi:uncharacterized protein Dvar_66340 [Desulfosarcina variabilis str. Montpellier]|uniref:hypothetical protein n=1 Tax=Desulfosarcina variabilis TaxID=2300 RepID=UPI003AFB256F
MKAILKALILIFVIPTIGMAQSDDATYETIDSEATYQTPVTQKNEGANDSRLLQRPEWDGAVVSGPWLSTELRYQDWDDKGTDFMLAPLFAMPMPMLDQLEMGLRFYLLHWDPDSDDYDDGFGLGDIDLWLKYQLLQTSQMETSAGLLVTLPLGDDSIGHPVASGEFNVELFGGLRYHVNDAWAVLAHLGIRKNADMDVEYKNGGSDKWEGEIQYQLSGGVICQVTPSLSVNGEFSYASNPYSTYSKQYISQRWNIYTITKNDDEDDIRLTGGAEYAIMDDLSIKGGIGIGLDDFAPEFDIILGFTYGF